MDGGRQRRAHWSMVAGVGTVSRRRSQQTRAIGWLKQVVTGFFAYHAVPTNFPALVAFRYHVTDLWRRTLRRRSQKDRTTWVGMGHLDV
jgi:hypothetical protein